MLNRINRIHDWKAWFALKHFRIYQGEHFRTSIKFMCHDLESAARYYKLLIQIEKGDDYIDVKVLGKIPRPPKKKRKKKTKVVPQFRYGPKVFEQLQEFLKSQEP